MQTLSKNQNTTANSKMLFIHYSYNYKWKKILNLFALLQIQKICFAYTTIIMYLISVILPLFLYTRPQTQIPDTKIKM